MVGMPSAWLIRVPRASAMKQENRGSWLKIGERAVRVNHPAHLVRDVIQPVSAPAQGDGYRARS